MEETRRSGWAGFGEVVADGDATVWRPNAEVAGHVYRGFELRLADLRGGGMRLIRPAGGFL